MKRKIIISSVLAILVCLCIIAGATFALFTSTNTINISVNSATVSLVATIDEDSLKTWSLYDTHDDAHDQNGAFELGGSADINDEKTGIDVVKMTPGDALQFVIKLDNQSNVLTKYRVRFTTEDVDTTDTVNLIDAFTWSVTTKNADGADVNLTADADNATDWISLAATAEGHDVTVKIEMPETVGNEYQNKDVKIAVIVEAVQGNATDDDAADAFN